MTAPKPPARSDIEALAREVLDKARARGVMIATAESCTGGMIAAALTDIAGSSVVVDRGFVTYSNEAKADMLGVPAELIREHGAVSEPVARAMAEGALEHSHATLAISVTGIAGPGGGSSDKPVGLVHFGCAVREMETAHSRMIFEDSGREGIRLSATQFALGFVSKCLDRLKPV